VQFRLCGDVGHSKTVYTKTIKLLSNNWSLHLFCNLQLYHLHCRFKLSNIQKPHSHTVYPNWVNKHMQCFALFEAVLRGNNKTWCRSNQSMFSPVSPASCSAPSTTWGTARTANLNTSFPFIWRHSYEALPGILNTEPFVSVSLCEDSSTLSTRTCRCLQSHPTSTDSKYLNHVYACNFKCLRLYH
jgi:hypothetical protein